MRGQHVYSQDCVGMAWIGWDVKLVKKFRSLTKREGRDATDEGQRSLCNRLVVEEARKSNNKMLPRGQIGRRGLPDFIFDGLHLTLGLMTLIMQSYIEKI